jgi:hypothetical protein
LAEIVGVADVDELLNIISRKQFSRWRAWFRVREAREWRRAGTIAAAAENASLIAKGITDPQAMVVAERFIPPMFLFQPADKPVPSDKIHNSLAAAFGPKY